LKAGAGVGDALASVHKHTQAAGATSKEVFFYAQHPSRKETPPTNSHSRALYNETFCSNRMNESRAPKFYYHNFKQRLVALLNNFVHFLFLLRLL
jgi:hypothetical protein